MNEVSGTASSPSRAPFGSFATGIELGFAMALIGFAGFAYLKGFPPP